MSKAMIKEIEEIREDLNNTPDEHLPALINQLSKLFEFPLPKWEKEISKKVYVSEVLNYLDRKMKSTKKLPELYLKAIAIPDDKVLQMAIKYTAPRIKDITNNQKN